MMTAKDFRDDPERTAGLRKALASPDLIEAMLVLAESGPTNIPLDANALTPTGAACMLGHAHGWADYPKSLKLLCERPITEDSLVNDDLQEKE